MSVKSRSVAGPMRVARAEVSAFCRDTIAVAVFSTVTTTLILRPLPVAVTAVTYWMVMQGVGRCTAPPTNSLTAVATVSLYEATVVMGAETENVSVPYGENRLGEGRAR